jgi:hypothetical protein
MDTFSLLAATDCLASTFRGCNAITAAGSNMTGTQVLVPTVAADASALIWYVATDTDGKLNNMTFSKGTNAHHAIQLGASAPNTLTLRGITFTGFNGANAADDSVLHLADQGSDKTWNIYTIGTSGTVSYKKARAGDTVNIIADPVTATATVTTATGTAIQSAVVMVKAANATGPFPFEESVTITNSGTTATVAHTGHGMADNDKVLIAGASHLANNGIFSITVTGADEYTYTMGSTPGSNPTGTIISTYVALFGTTDVNGQITMSRVFSADQPVTGWARKSSGSPYYKTGPINGTIDSADGASLSAVLVLDE